MKHRHSSRFTVLLLVTLLGSNQASAQCDGYARMARIASLAESLVTARSSTTLLEYARALSAELIHLDARELQEQLADQFTMVEPDWIPHTLQQLDRAVDAAQDGDSTNVTRIIERRRVTVGLARLQIGLQDVVCVEGTRPDVAGADRAVQSPFWPNSAPDDAEEPGLDGIGTHSSNRAAARDWEDAGSIAAWGGGLLVAVAALFGLLYFAAKRWRLVLKRRWSIRHPSNYRTLVRPRKTASARWTSEDAPNSSDETATRVLDVSRSGLAITRPNRPITTGMIEILIGDEWLIGKVRWQTKDAVGVRMSKRFSSQRVAEIAIDDADTNTNNPLDWMADRLLDA